MTSFDSPGPTNDRVTQIENLFINLVLYSKSRRPFQDSQTYIEHPIENQASNLNMSGNSSVGQASVYEAGDQRNSKDSENNDAERFHQGKAHSHKANDSSTKPAFSMMSVMLS